MAMTSDSGRGMTVEERDAFLTSGAMFAKIATTMADGWPVVSPVWFDWLAQDQRVPRDQQGAHQHGAEPAPRPALRSSWSTTPACRTSA